MTDGCRHLLCEIIGGACSLATQRSRGCRPNLTAREVAPETLDEVRALLAAIDPDAPTDDGRTAAVRLAAIVRREALEDRNLITLVGEDEPELASRLAWFCRRRA